MKIIANSHLMYTLTQNKHTESRHTDTRDGLGLPQPEPHLRGWVLSCDL